MCLHRAPVFRAAAAEINSRMADHELTPEEAVRGLHELFGSDDDPAPKAGDAGTCLN